MAESKFEIKITKEVDGSDIELTSMSLHASKSLVSILDAIIKMAESEPNSSDIKVGVKEGSASVELDAPDPVMESVQGNLAAALDRRATSSGYQEGVKELQKLFKANGLTYESNIFIGKQQIELVEFLKGKKKLKARKRKRTGKKLEFAFLKGRLIENGGVRPNIHVEVNGQKQKIKCNEKQARRVNKFLYADVFVSAWVVADVNDQPEYIFIDNYLQAEIFDEYRSEIDLIMKGSGTEPLLRIHQKFKELIMNDRLGDARKFLRLFTNVLVDNHMQRTVLVAAKAFRENQRFADLLDTIVKQLELKTGKHIF